MSAPTPMAMLANDPAWFAHRYDPGHDGVHLVRLGREDHRAMSFLDDQYLPEGAPKLVVRRDELLAASPEPAPIHFIFHSAFCCSTLLARLCDRPGAAMGLIEPPILNDMVGWRRRGGEPARVAAMLDGALRLLARPFEPGEAVVVKPSNIVNSLAAPILSIRPRARAVLLHAPLRTFLTSVVRKGMWGRLWSRELMAGLLKDGVAQFGFSGDELFGQTDLQIAALGWLMQQRLFGELAARFGPARVRTLDSEALLARPEAAVEALGELFDLAKAGARTDLDALGRHSKTGESFGADKREADYRAAADAHGDEIEKVATWAEAVAAAAGMAPTSASPLLAGT